MSTIGEGSAASQHTINYDALLSTTLFAYRKVLVDNVFKSNALLAAMRKFDGIDYQDGGERVAMPLMYGENATFKSYSGYGIIDTTPQEGISTAFFPWTEIGGSITISRREERQNSGEAAILKLLKAKIQQAEMSIQSQVNSQLVQGTVSGTQFVPGNGAKDLLPLGYFLEKDNTGNPAAGGNVGNISRAATDSKGNTWWKHRTATAGAASTDTGNDFALAVTTWKGVATAWKRMWDFCKRGGDGTGPNVILAGQIDAETYESALDEKVRYTDTGLADLGFSNTKCRGAVVLWDELVPDVYTGTVAITAGSAFFLNLRFLKLIIDKQTDFVTTPFVEPENQTAKTAKVLFMGQLACSNLRKQGVLYRLSQTIVS